MSKIVIVYHSGYGHTKKVAEAVAETSRGMLLAIDPEGNLPDGGWEALATQMLWPVERERTQQPPAPQVLFAQHGLPGSPQRAQTAVPTPSWQVVVGSLQRL